MTITKLCPRYEVKLVRNGSEAYTVVKASEKVNNSTSAKRIVSNIVRESMEDSPVELFGVITLDVKLKPIGFNIVTKGTLDSSLIHPREVFLMAITQMASAIILVHNHPSGDLTPSSYDYEATRRLKAAGEVLGIRVVDHIIVASDPDTNEWKSLSIEEGC